MKYPNLDKLKQYVIDGWVEENKHPLHDLYIYNYSRRTQYEGKWDETTIQARGLILDGDGNVIAKAFDKFFNYSELPPAHKAFGILAKERAIILDKVDGSMGIIFHYDNKWNVATRGSFMSDQAIKATEMLNNYNTELFNKELIYLVEICYVENTIVCVYSEDKLFFLSITKEMDELPWEECKKEFNRIGIPQDHIIKEYGNTFNYQALKDSFEENREGYIVRLEPSNYRVKVKFDEYVRLHKLITNFSNVDIWECLKKGDNIYAFLERVPDEFDKWVRDKVLELEKSFNYIEHVCKEKVMELNEQNFDNRKDIAMWIQTNVIPRYIKIMFLMIDNLDYKPIIWNLIRPKYQKPFWNNEK